MFLNLPHLENVLLNTSFLLLLMSTVYYWTKNIFYAKSNYSSFGLLGLSLIIFLLTSQLILRWIESGHFPLSNLYESFIFLAWSLLVLYSILERETKIDFVGVIICPSVLGMVCFASLILPPELQQSRPLVPALQSNWLFMHVSVMIVSYASFLLGCLLSILYLIFFFSFQTKKENRVVIEKNFSLLASTVSASPEKRENISVGIEPISVGNTENFLSLLDNLSYRTIGFGFCFLTLGILSGAVWANETWGSYWSWDPKETWAFITWLTFATYLHTRLVRAWEGVKPALLASFGLIIIWVCYLGVNLLGKGLHTYGFFTN